MSNKTVITFDVPVDDQFEINMLLPYLPPGAGIELENTNGRDGSYIARSSSYVLDVQTGDVTLFVRLRL
jgi:hypothetical protein